jgi:ankyrin repeat protein
MSDLSLETPDNKPNLSAYAGNLDFVVAFLRAGGPVSHADANGDTMLHAAATGWQHRMAELLILFDADVNALYVVRQSGHQDVSS